MKSTQDNLQPVQFRISQEEIDRLDRMAAKGGLTRSQFLRNLVVVGLEETETLERFGMVRAAITVRDICGWMMSKVSKTITEGDSDKGPLV